jgi:predicted Zn-dependent protease
MGTVKNSRFRVLVGVVIVLVLLIGTGCASSGSKKKKARKRTVLLTMSDDVRAGNEGAKAVEAEIGLLDDPVLNAYVEGLGKQLLKGLPRRDFAYKFSIVDQMEPNAFALPGGHVYVSRGLLALINNVDELACVIGHEIAHAARRHSAQQQEVSRYQGPLTLPRSRAATLAAYGRDMEREADAMGQRLCAAAGYDPMGMSTFLRSLAQRELLLIGAPRAPTFLDSHPGSRERASANSARAGELRWTRDLSIEDPRALHLDKIDGMAIGDRPETGVFVGELFLHPELDFEIKFPKGWIVQNSSQAVGATAPRREAAVFLTGDIPPGDLLEAADAFTAKVTAQSGVKLVEKKRVKLGDIDALRYGFQGGSGPFGISSIVTFFPFSKAIWRMVGMAPLAASDRYFGTILLAMKSFGPLTDEHRALIHSDRLRVVLARSGEDVIALGDRTGDILDPSTTALLNGMLGNEVFEGGELMKIVRREGASTR